ncbi:hypothetical protein SAZ_01940 [Streptomyces noursei ZPM]|uniref:Asp23/Gls24 family envelope stress response protein n=1 Tax=Streptomyces noursei TaxID=1971 RepID=A0A401QSP4_STRNR|nr:hypothetical protein [Streptomyces noursei]AKA01406.1 hypothetical protein SAZ_01940 [Streptomyces noursei ZPM]EOS99851.1 hypothetical protein K530_31798 [Streptomyces noursei CCRC 11814]EXU92249.1 hypothetical protein P354_25655 [Streptomyces noursei PD-1]GCB88431.1 hypothetical protein SALB_01101 [Streptomyces noursei]
MSHRTAREDLAAAIADAVLQVPGVAFLKPGLAARLQAAMPWPGRSRTAGQAGAVRITPPDAAGGVMHVTVEVVARLGHRALDVTRAVRTAAETAATEARAAPVSVRVTITNRV